MIDYTGIKCPVCGKPFSANDDIVVCPKCGAPYHRACYSQAGDCVFQDLHDAGKTWTAPENKQQEGNVGNKVCPVCGKMNADQALFCDRCGQSLMGNPQQPFGNAGYGQNNGYPPNQNNQQNNGTPPFGFPPYGSPMNGDPNQPGAPVPFMLDPMGGVNPSDQIEDVPAGDVAKLVQANTAYYLPTFINISRFKRHKFNFCAFLFTGGWMLYRKQYKLGAILTAIMSLLYVGSRYVSINYTMSILKSIGVNTDTYSGTYAQTTQIADKLLGLPPLQLFLFFLPTLLWFIQLVIMIIVGINANKWYCRHCIDTIHNIQKDTTTPTDYDVQLQSRGGVNIALALCIFVSFLIMALLPTLML